MIKDSLALAVFKGFECYTTDLYISQLTPHMTTVSVNRLSKRFYFCQHQFNSKNFTCPHRQFKQTQQHFANSNPHV